MSISKTSKLLQYINYRKYNNCCQGSPTCAATRACSLSFILNAGMRVTILDGRQIVGRYPRLLDSTNSTKNCCGVDLNAEHLCIAAGLWHLTDT